MSIYTLLFKQNDSNNSLSSSNAQVVSNKLKYMYVFNILGPPLLMSDIGLGKVMIPYLLWDHRV